MVGPKRHFVYITFDASHVYVGKAQDPDVRFKQHKSAARKGKGTHHYNWMRSVGEDNVSMVVVAEFATPDEAYLEERDLIAFFRSLKSFKVLNHADGGIGNRGNRWNEEQRRRRSIMITGAGNPFYGKKLSLESATQRQKTWRKNKELGLHKSTWTGSELRKQIARLNADHEEVVLENDGTVFRSISDAAKRFGISRGMVREICQGKRQSTKDGLVFKFR